MNFQPTFRAFVVILFVAIGVSLAQTGRAAEAKDARPARLLENPILKHLQPNPHHPATPSPANETLAHMFLPEGFQAELVVAEPDLRQPIAFTFDARGRIWVVEAFSYPQKRPAGEGLDRILIFEDTDGNGTFETRKIFTEGLNLVSGLEVGYGGVWVGAAPDLLFIPDRDGDDKPDGAPEVLLDGFGYQDTHETLNNFIWGPDGWLYGNQGVFNEAHIGKPGTPREHRIELRAGVWRYHPVRHVFEVFASGGSNQWGLDFDETGQLFMTQCRSYWGKGPTTHVIQSGHFWNQANQNYAPFISATAPREYPFFQNYLLASARYGHGEGGAGAPGSRKIYGGHSHVGTMIYLGDNWPDEYRNHLFTHNLHGHQMNQQINRPLGSGVDTVHAGKDVFYCDDPRYVAVDLKYGPDGAVYVIDWYDMQHCHNPNTERWDRGNGRIYRISYANTYRPSKVDLTRLSDLELVGLQSHKNEWFARMSRRLLQERALAQRLDPTAVRELKQLTLNETDAARRLRGLWAWQAVATTGIEDADLQTLLKNDDAFVRSWTIQLLTDSGSNPSSSLLKILEQMAVNDPSPVVRRYLASAIPRLPMATGWKLAEALSRHGEDANDRNLPLLVWQGLAGLMPTDLDRAFQIAETSRLPVLAPYVHWYAAKLKGQGLDKVVALLPRQDDAGQRQMMAALTLALSDQAGVPMPVGWPAAAKTLYDSQDGSIRWQAESLAAVFGDRSIFPRMRQTLSDAQAHPAERRHAFDILAKAADPDALPVFLTLLDDPAFRGAALKILGRFDYPASADAILQRFHHLSDQEKTAALQTLTSRATLAVPLLDAVLAGKVDKKLLTAFYIRQLTGLRNPAIDQRVTQAWGKVKQSSQDKEATMRRLEHTFGEAPLWAYSGQEGKARFQLLCGNCHRKDGEGAQIGPDLTGSGPNGVRYFLENIIDPNAVIGNDYQMTVVETKDDEVISGLVEAETDSSLSMRTINGTVVVSKQTIIKRDKPEQSMMPEGLFDTLNEREIIELLKYLTSG